MTKILHEAEIAALHAEADRHAAEATLARSRADSERLARDISEIMLERTRREEESEMARDHYNHRLIVRGTIDFDSAARAIGIITEWMRTEPGVGFEVAFYSPGGSIIDGFAIWDAIQMARAAGHHVTTSALGCAFSMAAVLLQAGDERVMYGQSWIMLHEASFAAGGKTSFITDQVEWVKAVQGRILDILAVRSTLSRDDIENRYNRKEWFISPEDALSYGFIDRIQ